MNEKCQVFTPENYVKELLDSVGYIEDCAAKGLSRTEIRNGLSRYIWRRN